MYKKLPSHHGCRRRKSHRPKWPQCHGQSQQHDYSGIWSSLPFCFSQGGRLRSVPDPSGLHGCPARWVRSAAKVAATATRDSWMQGLFGT